MRSGLLLATMAPYVLGTDGKCRALVLSGGSNNGAWEAGVMWGLLHYGEPADFAWENISGVSAGAINTCYTAVWPTGQELEMTEGLSDAWASIIAESQILVPDGWSPDQPASIAKAVLTQNHILSSDPAVEFMGDLIAPFGEVKRRWTTAALDWNTGEYV